MWPALTGPIAVGFDGSPQSRDALALGRELAGLTGERLVIAFVQPLNLPAIPDPTFIAGWKKRQALEAETLVDQAATIVGGNEGTDWWRCVVAALSPAQGLQYIVEHKEAGLVVLGHSHRQGAGVAVPGTTATRLLHGSPCAVAIAPPGWESRTTGITRVGAGVDGSDESRTALASAAVLADRAGGSLEAVTVFRRPNPANPLFAMTTRGYGETVADLQEVVERRLREAVDQLEKRSIADVESARHRGRARRAARRVEHDPRCFGSSAPGATGRCAASWSATWAPGSPWRPGARW